MGVKDLMARFEQKGDSPPDRGRSPGPGLGNMGGSPSDSPRPLSKVRTSFVTIEKDGRMGLRRDLSGDSAYSSRRLSNDTEGTTSAPLQDKSNMFEQDMAKSTASARTDLSKEPIPESPRRETPPKEAKTSPKKGGLAPNPNPDKITDEEEPNTKLTIGDPTNSAATNKGSNGSSNGVVDKVKTTTLSKGNPKVIPIPSPRTTKPPAKSPITAKAPRSPAKETAKTPIKAIEKKTTTPAAARGGDPSKQSSSARPTPSGSAKKPAPIELSPSNTGFVKPKPKSPTRPVKLPSSLTTHTASSASKFGSGSSQPPRQTHSRASGNISNLSVPAGTGRSPSRASTTSTRTTATQKSQNPSLRRQSSTINRPRPSIGPPPKPAAKEYPPSKKDANANPDDSFLARMMRPTQSSSSKTNDKAPTTPPRKQPAAASALHKKPISDGSAKKAASRIIDSGKAKAKEAEKVAKKPVEKVAEKTNGTNGNHGTSLTSSTEKKLEGKKEEPTAKEVAPVVAQKETADAAIEAAKESHDTATTPLVEEKQLNPPAEPETELEPEPESDPEPVLESTQETVKEPEPEATIPEQSESIISVVEEEPVVETEALIEEEDPAEKDAVPVIAEDPEKVEDIEEVIQEEKPEPIEEEPQQDQEASEVVLTPSEEQKEENGLEHADDKAKDTVDIADKASTKAEEKEVDDLAAYKKEIE